MHSKNATRTALFALGFLSIGTQVYLAREFMMTFNDNELVIGLVLSAWMMFTGAGAYFGRFLSRRGSSSTLTLMLLLLAGIMPPFMVAALDVLKVFLVPYGSLAGPGPTSVACIVTELPFCLVNGFLFSLLSLSSRDNDPGDSYAWESIGSMVSGVLVNFIFLWVLGPFRGMLFLTAAYMLLVLSYAMTMCNKKTVFVTVALSAVFLLITGMADLREYTLKLMYPAQHVISDNETPYGSVVITMKGRQLNFFENGALLFSSGNEISNEENVHYAMVQHPGPASVLLISGGFTGTLAEILKYRPMLVDYVELNPSLISIASEFTRQLENPAIRVHETDARKFVRTTGGLYDVVLVNLPPPATLHLNRCYSLEFLSEVRRKMRPGALIAFSLPATGEYVSGKAALSNAVIMNTLEQCFSKVLVIPAGRNYFLASDSALSPDIPGLIRSRRIETVYVNEFYLDPAGLRERSDNVMATLNHTLSDQADPSGCINRDFTPVAAWYQLSWWMSRYETSRVMILLVFTLVFFFLLVTLNPINSGLFSGGFTLASLEIILIFGMQVLCGYLYSTIGVIIMVFMLGLAAGSAIRFSSKFMYTPQMYRWLQVILALSAMAVPFIIQSLSVSGSGDYLIYAVFTAIAFLTAFIVGMEYRLAAFLSDRSLEKTIAGNYSAEMFGAAAGAFLAALFLVPLIGMIYTGLFLALLNLATAAAHFVSGSRPANP